MKSIKFSTVVVAVAVIAVGTWANETAAQVTWGNGRSSSFSKPDGNPQGNDSIELIPYGRNSDYETGRPPIGYDFNRSYRSPYQTDSHDHSAGCGHGGACNHEQLPSQVKRNYRGESHSCPGGHCSHEHNHSDVRSNANRQVPDGSYFNAKLYANAPNYVNEQTFATQDRRRPEFDQRNPADQRPQLRTPPSIAPQSNFSNNNSGRQFGALQLVPPTSTQLMPAPKLPPRRSTDPHAGDNH